VRPYTRTYDSNEVTQVGGIAVVALGNAVDLNNTTGQYEFTFTTGGAGAFTVGEEITTTSGKRGLVTASDTGTDGDVAYALKSGTQFVATDVITGSVSAKSATLTGTVTDLVAGYDSDIRVMTVNSIFTGGTTASGPYVIGEQVTQAGGGAYVGYILEDDDGDLYTEDVSGTRANSQVITGSVSGATNTPTGNADQTDVPKDIGGGVGDKDYTAVVSADITDADPQPVLNVYEWWKFITRRESTALQGGPGSASGVEGRIFRRLVDTFAEVRGASPYGSKAGSLVIGAQGVFIQKETLVAADLRNIQLIDNLGDTYDPPNLQTIAITNLVSGVRGAIYRTTGSGSTTILRTEFAVDTPGGGYNQAADSYIKVKANTRSVSPLPSDVPDTGVLRVLDPAGSGDYLRFLYDQVDRTNNWFHLTQGIGQNTINDVAGEDLDVDDNVHVVFVEEEATGTSVSNTVQYVADIYLLAVARVKGKKPFSTTSTFDTGGAAIGAVLLPDDVVNLP
jgi:hypothetical protein